MNILINLLIFFYYFNTITSYNYIIGNEADIVIDIPKPEYNWLIYYLKLNIYICNYANNDSYLAFNNSITKISESNYYSYPRSQNNKIININGSDLKFIDYGVITQYCKIIPNNNFTLTNNGSKYQIKIKDACSSDFFLYILKDDTSYFINLCELYYKNSSNIVFTKQYSWTQEKERTLEFELDKNLDDGIYKVVLLEKRNSMIYRYMPQFITINNKKNNILIIALSITISLYILVIILAIILYNKKKKKNNSNNINMNENNDSKYITEGYEEDNAAPIIQFYSK